jgi:hypothetical protein
MRKNDVVTFDSFKGCCKNQIKHKRLVPVSAGPVLPPAGSLPVSPAAAPLFPASSPVSSPAATENGGGNDYGEIEQLCSNIYEQCQKLSIRRPRLSIEEPGSHPNVPGWYLTCRWTKEDEALIVTSMEEWEALLEERLQQKGDA